MPRKATTPPAVAEDAVRTRAYLLWEADGRPEGRDAHYWGMASAELLTPAKRRKPADKKVKPASKPAKPGKTAARAAKPAAKPRKK